jgi:hypothetical protein
MHLLNCSSLRLNDPRVLPPTNPLESSFFISVSRAPKVQGPIPNLYRSTVLRRRLPPYPWDCNKRRASWRREAVIKLAARVSDVAGFPAWQTV